MSSRRDKICAKIRALRAKTVANGCTEEEALAAAAKVVEMLAAYDLDLDEVEMRETPFAQREESHEDGVGDRLWKPASAIAELTNTRYWASRAGVRPYTITFFGFEHEVEIASYLVAICSRAMRDRSDELDGELAFMRASVRRRQKLSFLDGMADRLRTRILALKPKRPPGKGLVVLHDAMIDAELDVRGIRIRDGRGESSMDLDSRYHDGVEAADEVSLDPGVRGPAAAAFLTSPESDGTPEDATVSEMD